MKTIDQLIDEAPDQAPTNEVINKSTLDITPRFAGMDIRILGTPEDPLFVAKDVCHALGLSNPSQALATLDHEEKGICESDTLGGKQSLLVVTESGLYTLTFKSLKDEAKKFRKWVTSEVLPSIRKSGSYSPQINLDDPETLRGMLLGYTEQVINLKAEVATLAPKAAGLERIANTEETYCITDAAKTLNVQPKRLFDFLESNRWIYRRHNEWIAMQDKLNARLMIHKIRVYEGSASVHSVTQARLTAKGVAKLSEMLALPN